jgi:hypothetical protein
MQRSCRRRRDTAELGSTGIGGTAFGVDLHSLCDRDQHFVASVDISSVFRLGDRFGTGPQNHLGLAHERSYATRRVSSTILTGSQRIRATELAGS